MHIIGAQSLHDSLNCTATFTRGIGYMQQAINASSSDWKMLEWMVQIVPSWVCTWMLNKATPNEFSVFHPQPASHAALELKFFYSTFFFISAFSVYRSFLWHFQSVCYHYQVGQASLLATLFLQHNRYKLKIL